MLGRRKLTNVAAYFAGGLSVIGAWGLLKPLIDPPRAYGQVPDAGAQRAEMIAELKQSNKTLNESVSLLREIRDQLKTRPADPKPPK